MRRSSWAWPGSADRGGRGGTPSTTATRPRPCDSPAVVNRKVTVLQASHSTRARPWVGLGAHHLAGGPPPPPAGNRAAGAPGGAAPGAGGGSAPPPGGGGGGEARRAPAPPP